jgi:hypothetical protein
LKFKKPTGPHFKSSKAHQNPTNQPNRRSNKQPAQFIREREKTMAGGGGSSLAGLQDHVKLARDYALEGLYDTSIIFFDGAVAQINRFFTLLFSFLF